MEIILNVLPYPIVVYLRRRIEIWRRKKRKYAAVWDGEILLKFVQLLSALQHLFYFLVSGKNLKQSDFVLFSSSLTIKISGRKIDKAKDSIIPLYRATGYSTLVHTVSFHTNTVCQTRYWTKFVSKNKCRFWYANCHAIILTQNYKVFFLGNTSFYARWFPLSTDDASSWEKRESL